jgi:hypothetical protein
VIHRTVWSKDHRVHWDIDRMGRGLRTTQITLIICYQIESIVIPKMCWWLCMRFCIILSRCLSVSSAALLAVREEQEDEKVEVLVRHRA